MTLRNKQTIPTPRKILQGSLQAFLHACFSSPLLCRREGAISRQVCGVLVETQVQLPLFCSSYLNFRVGTVSQCRYIYSVWILNS